MDTARGLAWKEHPAAVFPSPADHTAPRDLTAGLTSLQPECGAGELPGELPGELVKRRLRLALTACADALFFCKLLLYTREPERAGWIRGTAPRSPPSRADTGLRVGIVGAGRLGRQLARCLIETSGLRAEEIRISTRRPETLGDFRERGVICSYDNVALASWAHVLFLCCLPCQLPGVCAEIEDHVGQACVVYSLVSAVPLSRLRRLLGPVSLVRPEYRSAGATRGRTRDCTTAALRDPDLLKSTNPRDSRASRFPETSLYAALNTCRERGLCHRRSLRVLNALLQGAETWGEAPRGSRLRTEDLVSAECAASLSEGSLFPWFDLSAVQSKETPLSRHVAQSPRLQETLALLYFAVLGIHTMDVEESDNPRYPDDGTWRSLITRVTRTMERGGV
ncbi:NADP-dependent oxidoreductase domain-containing protein 1 [Spea bombifrons]|uniref:NADP-dependent oxidoreductase domain-containing protein 1 n=1 Tax=Spea bombifrons TaxID=233779 RepID=UPI00234B2749|nr:NADP-dependent oxidoreductase domain-containing protein 1 [Spea bombifrons]